MLMQIFINGLLGNLKPVCGAQLSYSYLAGQVKHGAVFSPVFSLEQNSGRVVSMARAFSPCAYLPSAGRATSLNRPEARQRARCQHFLSFRAERRDAFARKGAAREKRY